MSTFSNFTIQQDPNGAYFLKYDMGSTYYRGLININCFGEEFRENYIDIVKEAIEFFGKESTKTPKIMSLFEFANGDKNNFMIKIEVNNNFMNIQRLIKFEMTKYVKNVDEYIREQELKIKELKKITDDQSLIVNECKKSLIEKDAIIKTQNDKITNLENEFKIMKESFEKIKESIPKQNNSFNLPQTNLFSQPFIAPPTAPVANTNNFKSLIAQPIEIEKNKSIFENPIPNNVFSFGITDKK